MCGKFREICTILAGRPLFGANLNGGMATLATAIAVQGVGVVNLAHAVNTPVYRPFRPSFHVLPLAASG